MAQGSSSVGRKESSWYYPCVSGRARFMQLLYDPRDDAFHERIGSQILYWLDDLDAIPLHEASPATEGFLFAGARPINDYRGLVAHLPLLCDKTWEQVPSFLWGNQPPPDWLTPAPPPLQDLPTTALRVCPRSPASPRSRASSPTSRAREKPGFSKKPGFFSHFQGEREARLLQEAGLLLPLPGRGRSPASWRSRASGTDSHRAARIIRSTRPPGLVGRIKSLPSMAAGKDQSIMS